MTKQIRPVRRHVNDDLLVRNRNGFQKWRSRWSLRVELQNAGLISAKTELLCRAEHAIGLDAANLAALELESARQGRTDGRERIQLPGLHVRGPAHHLERRTVARIHLAERQPIGVRVLLHLEHPRDHDLAQVLMDRHDAIDGGDLAGEPVGDVVALERAAEQRFEPATGNYHGVGSGDPGV